MPLCVSPCIHHPDSDLSIAWILSRSASPPNGDDLTAVEKLVDMKNDTVTLTSNEGINTVLPGTDGDIVCD